MVLGVLITACDLPTDAPIIVSRLAVPVADDSVGVQELLPQQVGIRGGQFRIVPDSIRAVATLADLCPPCRPLHGTLAPVPMTTMRFTVSTGLPAGLARLTLGTGSTATLEIANGLGFDPLRPSAGQFGTLTLVVRGGGPLGDTVAVDRVAGMTTGLPPGGSLRRTLPLSQGRTVADPIEILMELQVPPGDPVIIDTTQTVALTGAPVVLLATAAGVEVDMKPVASATAAVSFTDAGDDAANRVDSADVHIAILNPFAVAGQFAVTFDSSGSPVTGEHRVDLDPGSQTRSFRLGTDETRALLTARNVSARVTGVVDGDAASNRVVTLRPRDVIGIGTVVVLFVRLGG